MTIEGQTSLNQILLSRAFLSCLAIVNSHQCSFSRSASSTDGSFRAVDIGKPLLVHSYYMHDL